MRATLRLGRWQRRYHSHSPVWSNRATTSSNQLQRADVRFTSVTGCKTELLWPASDLPLLTYSGSRQGAPVATIANCSRVYHEGHFGGCALTRSAVFLTQFLHL